jgi:hypothetical protein
VPVMLTVLPLQVLHRYKLLVSFVLIVTQSIPCEYSQKGCILDGISSSIHFLNGMLLTSNINK